MVFGSHLYGLNTENSDKDYKGIILPSKKEILLGKSHYHVDKSTNSSSFKNTKDDIDRSFYTLSYFIDMACKGDSTPIDMVHGNSDKLIQGSEIWRFIVSNRTKFYTKSMKSYVGYCKKQAAKYGIKGSRLGELERALNVLNQYSNNDIINDVQIEESDVIRWIEYKGNNYLEICGSKFQDNLRISYAKDTLSKIFDRYGQRTKLAKENKNLDWKALSHSVRVGYQTYHILKDNGFEYPLDESNYIMDIKLGKLPFQEVEETLTQLVGDIEQLTLSSTYPNEVNRDFWDDFICQIYKNIVVND
jgi:predicted nucleotidyltransferase